MAEQTVTSTATKAKVIPKKAPPFSLSGIKKKTPWVKLLIYGAHGAGKTTLAGSAVDVESMGDIVMINAESGDLVLQGNDRVKAWEDIDTIPVNKFDEVVKIYEWLSSHIKFRDSDNVDKLCEQEAWLRGCEKSDIEKPKRFKTVIIDSLTEVEAYCMYKLLGVHGEFSTEMLDEDTKTPEFKEYKQNNNMVNLLVRAFRDLPMNVIFLCGRSFEQDEMKRYHYSPTLTGKLRGQVQGYVDVVGYLVAGKSTGDAGETPRRLYVQPEGKWDAKNRFSTYKQGYFDNPTMLTIMKSLGKIG